jgi:hypothetical protein
MQLRVKSAAVGLIALAICGPGSAAQDLCGPLRKFVDSVKPDESRAIAFHTSWGEDFEDSHDSTVISARRCDHKDYGPAKAVCTYLMQHGAVEFAGNNAKAAITCLAQKTNFGPRLLLHDIDISLSYGTPNHGSDVEIKYSQDATLGGMVLSITAMGY